jgi:hypothetical protein
MKSLPILGRAYRKRRRRQLPHRDVQARTGRDKEQREKERADDRPVYVELPRLRRLSCIGGTNSKEIECPPKAHFAEIVRMAAPTPKA